MFPYSWSAYILLDICTWIMCAALCVLIFESQRIGFLLGYHPLALKHTCEFIHSNIFKSNVFRVKRAHMKTHSLSFGTHISCHRHTSVHETQILGRIFWKVYTKHKQLTEDEVECSYTTAMCRTKVFFRIHKIHSEIYSCMYVYVCICLYYIRSYAVNIFASTLKSNLANTTLTVYLTIPQLNLN